jgi:sugar lactone lactonase YvrE
MNRAKHLSSRTVLAVLALLACSGAGATAQPFPEIIPLPNGFQPEGIARGRGSTAFVGSLGGGAVYRVDLRTGAGEILVPGTGTSAVGLSFDRRTGFLFVAGGQAGTASVYDTRTGGVVASAALSVSPTFINDVVVTRDAAYFTDSFAPVVHRVALKRNGRLVDPADVQSIPLGGDFSQVPGFNANGIEATPDGRSLIIVNSAPGELFRVDPSTGVASLIDLGGATLPFGDGLLLNGKTLYVVQNRLNQIAVVKLSNDYSSGSIEDVITDPDFDVPQTIAAFGNALYAVNARFGTTPTPDTEYDVVKVDK